MNKKLLVSTLALAVISSATIVGTIAFFSDSEKSGGNTFAAGDINLTVGNESYYNGSYNQATSWLSDELTVEKFFDYEDLKPGDWGEDTISMLVGSNEAWACGNIAITQNDDNGIVDSEDEVDGSIDGLDGTINGDLANEINFVVWLDDGDNVLESDESVLLQDNLSIALDGGFTFTFADSTENVVDSSGGLDPNVNHYIGKAWCYGDLGLNPVTQDGYGNQMSPEGSIENSGITCDGSLVTNLSQTDKLMANVSFYAEQVQNNPDFVCSDSLFPAVDQTFVTYEMENKRVKSDWSIVEDDTYGELNYLPSGPTFDYEFDAQGLQSNKDYCLIYYADPWPGNNPGALLGEGASNSSGELSIVDSVALGHDIPHPDDENHLIGGKVWLIPCANYDESSNKVDPWAPNEVDWLFDDDVNGMLVNYTYTETSPTSITINNLGSDIDSQYGYTHDYSGANVTFEYDTPTTNMLTGQISATGLKPYTTYQAKFSGIPTCVDPIDGNDTLNESIGYKGRWTCVSCTGTAVSKNRSDAQYEANKLLPDTDPSKECIAGYLVWDYFTADSGGNASKTISTQDSYHVLWCGGGTCNNNTNTDFYYPDASYPAVAFCPATSVNGQTERASIGCGALTMDSGNYNLIISLTEESFHQGNWATVLQNSINFEIL